MDKIKSKSLRIRITESQFKTICQLIKEEEMTKSQFIRKAIEDKIVESYRENINNNNQS